MGEYKYSLFIITSANVYGYLLYVRHAMLSAEVLW